MADAAKTYTPVDPVPLSGTVVIWLYVDMAASLLGAAAAALEMASGAINPDSPPPLRLVAVFAQLGVTLVTGFLILKLIYRYSRNAHALVPTGLEIRPPWAVGWFFVPIAFLWMPFKGVREAWQVSTDPVNWKTVPTPSQLRLWWGLWLGTNLIANLSFRLSQMGGSEAAAASDVVEIIGDLVGVGADLVFIAVVRRLTAMQTEALSGKVFA